MKAEGYGKGYRYDHDEPDAFSGQDYFPEKMGRQTFYDPPDRGFEREIRKRLEYWAKLRRERSGRGLTRTPLSPDLRQGGAAASLLRRREDQFDEGTKSQHLTLQAARVVERLRHDDAAIDDA